MNPIQSLRTRVDVHHEPVDDAAPDQVVTSQSIVAALLGSSSVTLNGFRAEPVAMPWLRVDAPLASLADGSTASINAGYLSRNRTMATLLAIGCALSLVAAAAGGFIAAQNRQEGSGVQRNPKALPTTAQLEWTVTGVRPDGLLLDVGGAPLKVRPGDALPNGEILSATHPQQQAYVTNRSTVLVTGLAPLNARTAPPATQAGSSSQHR